MSLATLVRDLQRLLATRRAIDARLDDLSHRIVVAYPEAAELAALVVRLYDPLVEECWLRGLWVSTQILLATTAVSLGAPVSVRKDLVLLVHELRNTFGSDGRADLRRPPLVRLPFAAFHWDMWRSVAQGQGSAYVAGAALIHARVRGLEHGMLSNASRFGPRLDRNLYRYLRSARVFCLYGPRLKELSAPLRHDLIHASR